MKAFPGAVIPFLLAASVVLVNDIRTKRKATSTGTGAAAGQPATPSDAGVAIFTAGRAWRGGGT